jgi:hypothetical protein
MKNYFDKYIWSNQFTALNDKSIGETHSISDINIQLNALDSF